MNESIRSDIREKIFSNSNFFTTTFNEDEINHIINISISIINTRDKSGPIGGGFVQAIVDNDLSNALSRADDTSFNAIKFFTYIKDYYNPEVSLEQKLYSIYDEANRIVQSDISWEEKYDLIFSENISKKVFSLCSLDYYDPDTTYEEDTLAFMSALENRVNN